MRSGWAGAGPVAGVPIVRRPSTRMRVLAVPRPRRLTWLDPKMFPVCAKLVPCVLLVSRCLRNSSRFAASERSIVSRS